MPLPVDYQTNRGVTPGRGRKISPVALVMQTWINPAAAVTNGISTIHTGLNQAGTRSSTFNGSLVSGGVAKFDYPRNVVITVTHATAVVAMSGVITGVDIAGRQQTEAWSVTAGTASKTFTGKKAFAYVTDVSEVTAADASANSIIVGSGVLFGLQANAAIASGVKETSAGSVVTNGTVVKTSSASTDDPRGTYSPSSAPNGSTTYELVYVADPERSR